MLGNFGFNDSTIQPAGESAYSLQPLLADSDPWIDPAITDVYQKI